MRCFYFILLSLLFSTPAIAMDSYADIVEKVMPSVVNISTEREIIDSEENDVDNLMVEPQLDGRESLGSGFFIRNDGYILTNYHIIDGAKSIEVITHNSKNYKATIIGIDKPSDLAVLKIEAKKEEKFQAVIFGDVDDTRIGDRVLTFGNPYGLGISVSEGIISAKSRNIGLGEQHYIQTDAAINQGNSGGPMFNLEGEVIGVNTAIFSIKGASGVGFALPANIANWVSSQLTDGGKVHRGWLGLSVSYGIDQYTDKSGFMVTEISEESNAYKEGIRVGDIIIAYNDKTADDINEFRVFTETMEPSQALRLKTLSFGEEIRHLVRIQEMPAAALKDITNKALIEHNKYYHQDLDKNVFYISELSIAVKEANPRGLMIVKIERKSPLYGKGIKNGDVILEADRSDIYSVENLLESIRNATSDEIRPVALLIQSIDNTFYVNVEAVPEND